jgi:hypothetical protein
MHLFDMNRDYEIVESLAEKHVFLRGEIHMLERKYFSELLWGPDIVNFLKIFMKD